MSRQHSKFLLLTLLLAMLPVYVWAEVPEEEDAPEEEIEAPAPPKAEEKPPVTVPTQKVSVAPTQEITVDDFGALDAGKGGYPADIWKGAARKDIVELLPLIAPQAHAPLRDPLAKLLLTKAHMPGGKSDGDDLLTLRLRALVALGKEAQALEVIQSLPVGYVNESHEKLRIELLLLKPDAAAACEAVSKAGAKYDNSYWHKLNIFCLALNKKFDEVQLGLDLLEEEQKEPSPAFFTELLEKLKDPAKEIKSYPASLSLLDAGMALAASKPSFPVAVLQQAPVPLLKLVAANKEAAPEQRTVAIEKLVLWGLEDPAKLRDAYATFTFTSKELASSPSKPTAFKEVKGRALLYQMAEKTTDDNKRAELLNRAVTVFNETGLRSVLYKAFLPAWQKASKAAPEEETLLIAPDIFAALVAGGQMDDAVKFADKLSAGDAKKKENSANPLPGYISHALLALQQGKPLPALGFYPPAEAQPRDISRLFRLYAMQAALGQEIKPSPSWLHIYASSTASFPFPSLTADLHKAGKAETLLLSGVIVGDADLGRLSDGTIDNMVRALMQAGFTKEARALAVEAVIYSPQ